MGCVFKGTSYNHKDQVTAFDAETLAWDATEECSQQTRQCYNSALTFDTGYNYATCTKGIPTNCSSNASYEYNNSGRIYSIDPIDHGNTDSSTMTKNENDGEYEYTLNLQCNDGGYINETEDTPILQICDEGFTQEGNECKANCSENTSYDTGYNVPALIHGANKTGLQAIVNITGGVQTYTADISCSDFVLSKTNETNITTCSEGYIYDNQACRLPTSCEEVETVSVVSPNGTDVYSIDLGIEGITQLSCNDGWTLVSSQDLETGGLFENLTDAKEYSKDTPNHDKYSILNNLEDFRADNGTFTFKLEWPDRDYEQNTWTQTSNPMNDIDVTGYHPIDTELVYDGFGGLEYNGSPALFDGAVNHASWTYAVGQVSNYHGYIPSDSENSTKYTNSKSYNLWVKKTNPVYIKSCKEILDNYNVYDMNGYGSGLSYPMGTSGIYRIDPESNGVGFDVVCDMVTDGGGRTLTAQNKGNAANFNKDFMVDSVNPLEIDNLNITNSMSSIDVENFSLLVNTTDAMLKSATYASYPIIDNGTGNWNYDNTDCSGALGHTSRTQGCSNHQGSDNYDSVDRFNIAIYGGYTAIVPYYYDAGYQLCRSYQEYCDFEFYLR